MAGNPVKQTAKSTDKGQAVGKPTVPARASKPIAASPWESELERFFDEFRFPWPRWLRPGQRLFHNHAFIQPPAIDVVDENGHLVVKAELPGLSKDDVQVELTDSTLIIRGEKKHEKETKEQNYYRSECEYGSVYRSIHLPVPVKTEDVSAAFKDGVLEIRMPKTEEAKRKAVKLAVK